MNQTSYLVRNLLEAQGGNPKEIDATIALIEEQDKSKKWSSLRSWIALLISLFSLIVAIYK